MKQCFHCHFFTWEARIFNGFICAQLSKKERFILSRNLNFARTGKTPGILKCYNDFWNAEDLITQKEILAEIFEQDRENCAFFVQQEEGMSLSSMKSKMTV
ncbi:hypothetical protein K7I13_13520 [Brucepastera parasyntrophica]|uniref:hypothetical protein n=1 Tax=Brucepastera parasyntrophica TaxID=2880008 RepID=UPI00210E8F36|nr:hypothetical protein [Brucepastera parasyntrophica]ULQ59476.1 hypothetical protein K7I13_13520 [Brucepastera parasyntrophica]